MQLSGIEMQKNGWLFYRSAEPVDRLARALPVGYTCEMWTPSAFRVKPKGVSLFPVVVWWLFHSLHLFSNREYGLLVIRQGGRVVHRSVITPGYPRFPFMAKEDIQVGDTWTDPAVRGRGLATIALENIVRTPRYRNRSCWYIVETDNTASIRVVEKAGFMLTGCGIRIRRFGLGVLGQFRLTESTTVR
jgi:RimJ/RimL family protein N-acetyltransferase